MDLIPWAALVLVACSGGKPKAVEDARGARRADATPVRDAGPIGPYRVDDTGPKGDVAVRVEWHDVPVAARSAQASTPCGTRGAPAVAPTTTWGIPDVFVLLAVDHGKPLAARVPRIALDHCALVPRVAAAGGAVVVASSAEAPAEVVVVRESELARFGAIGEASGQGEARHVQLPIAGHEVEVSLAPGIYELAMIAEPHARAWVVAADQPYVEVTDASGQATLRDVPVGTYPVTAWLAPPGGTPGRAARGEVTVAAGQLAELTLQLAPVP